MPSKRKTVKSSWSAPPEKAVVVIPENVKEGIEQNIENWPRGTIPIDKIDIYAALFCQDFVFTGPGRLTRASKKLEHCLKSAEAGICDKAELQKLYETTLEALKEKKGPDCDVYVLEPTDIQTVLAASEEIWGCAAPQTGVRKVAARNGILGPISRGMGLEDSLPDTKVAQFFPYACMIMNERIAPVQSALNVAEVVIDILVTLLTGARFTFDQMRDESKAYGGYPIREHLIHEHHLTSAMYMAPDGMKNGRLAKLVRAKLGEGRAALASGSGLAFQIASISYLPLLSKLVPFEEKGADPEGLEELIVQTIVECIVDLSNPTNLLCHLGSLSAFGMSKNQDERIKNFMGFRRKLMRELGQPDHKGIYIPRSEDYDKLMRYRNIWKERVRLIPNTHILSQAHPFLSHRITAPCKIGQGHAKYDLAEGTEVVCLSRENYRQSRPIWGDDTKEENPRRWEEARIKRRQDIVNDGNTRLGGRLPAPDPANPCISHLEGAAFGSRGWISCVIFTAFVAVGAQHQMPMPPQQWFPQNKAEADELLRSVGGDPNITVVRI